MTSRALLRMRATPGMDDVADVRLPGGDLLRRAVPSGRSAACMAGQATRSRGGPSSSLRLPPVGSASRPAWAVLDGAASHAAR
jgi:hypothetical protein